MHQLRRRFEIHEIPGDLVGSPLTWRRTRLASLQTDFRSTECSPLLLVVSVRCIETSYWVSNSTFASLLKIGLILLPNSILATRPQTCSLCKSVSAQLPHFCSACKHAGACSASHACRRL